MMIMANDDDNDGDEKEYPIVLRANYNTTKRDQMRLQNKFYQAQQHTRRRRVYCDRENGTNRTCRLIFST